MANRWGKGKTVADFIFLCSKIPMEVDWSYEIKRHFSRLLVQDGRVEGHALISSCKSIKIATSYWTTINRRMLEPIKKRYPMSKDKEELRDGRRGAIMMTSNPIPIGWTTHKLENNNTKEVLPLLWRFRTPRQASQPGYLTETRNPRESCPWRPAGCDYRTSTGLGETMTPILDGTNKILHAPRPRGKQWWPHRRLNQNNLMKWTQATFQKKNSE